MSERELSDLVKTALDEGTIRPAIFVELLFDSGPVRVWSGVGPMRLDTVEFGTPGSPPAVSESIWGDIWEDIWDDIWEGGAASSGAFQGDAFQEDTFQVEAAAEEEVPATPDVTTPGNVFLGVGTFGSIDKVEESASDVRATGIAMTLSGIPSEMIALCLTEFFVNRPATIWLALFDENGAIIPNAIQIFKGRMDFPVIDEGGETATITVTAESILIDLERPRIARYTHEDQVNKFPDDLGLEFVASIQNVDIVWKSAG